MGLMMHDLLCMHVDLNRDCVGDGEHPFSGSNR